MQKCTDRHPNRGQLLGDKLGERGQAPSADTPARGLRSDGFSLKRRLNIGSDSRVHEQFTLLPYAQARLRDAKAYGQRTRRTRQAEAGVQHR